MELDMDLMIAGGTAAVLTVALIFSIVRRRRKAKKSATEWQGIKLEEMVKGYEIINTQFVQTLDVVRNNLEALVARAERAEEKLKSILSQAEAGKKDQYSMAALLLSEGKEISEVARALGLPPSQVRLVKELRDVSAKEKAPAVAVRENGLKPVENHLSAAAIKTEEKSSALPEMLKALSAIGDKSSLWNGKSTSIFGGAHR